MFNVDVAIESDFVLRSKTNILNVFKSALKLFA
jgi:hypothetical protein